MDAWSHKVGQIYPIVVFSAYQPLRSQYSPIISSPDSSRSVTPCPPSTLASHPFVSARDTTSTCATAQIFSYFAGNLKAAASNKGCLKGNKLMHTVCKFHMRAYFPSKVKIA